MRSYYCRKCCALIDESEVNAQDASHVVQGFLTAQGEERAIIHTGLVRED